MTSGLLGISRSQAIFAVQNRFKISCPSTITEAEINTLFNECKPFFDQREPININSSEVPVPLEDRSTLNPQNSHIPERKNSVSESVDHDKLLQDLCMKVIKKSIDNNSSDNSNSASPIRESLLLSWQ